jgi:hypothetical protein
MNDASSSYGSNHAIKVQLDPDIMQDLIFGTDGEVELRDERARITYERNCALREHQIYRLMRSLVSQFNGRLKGRRERFKLVEEGDGLVLEFSL